LILTIVAASASAQTSMADVDPSVYEGITSVRDLDLTEASIHQAGPNSFYVRSVGVGEDSYSLTFALDENGLWVLDSLNPESDNVLPERTVLDFASLTAAGEQTLRIDGVFLDGEVYSGTLAIGEDAALSLVADVESGNVDAVNQVRALALAELVVAETEEAFEAELAEQRAELEAIIAILEAQRDGYKSERDALASTRDALVAERDSLAEQLAAIDDSTTAPAVDGEPAITDEELTALRTERDDLAVSVAGLESENEDLQDRNRALAEEIADLQSENEQLRSELADMNAEVARLTDLVDAYRSAQDDAGGDTTVSTPPAFELTVPDDYARQADLEAAAAAVVSELKALETRVAGLEAAARELAGLEEAIRTSSEADVSPTATATEPADPELANRLSEVMAQLADLRELNDALRREKNELENRILHEILSDGLIAMMRQRMTETLHSGFGGSTPDVGDWSVRGDRAVQADSDAFFAKLAVPAFQTDRPVLYSFRVRSLDADGWVGVGLHFFVSEVELRRGYGMGRSLLVWFTRDPDVYKTRNTYLQLYRSDDDINMGRVLDAVVEEPISSHLDVEVLYEPDNQYVTIAVGGQDKVRYRTWFGIDSGVEVALRSLGAAEFSNFRIRTEPE
jgi:cell division protein FtsB